MSTTANGKTARPARVGARLGEVLVGMGFIDAETLEAALHEQRADGRRLGEFLVATGRIEPDQLARALAHRLGVLYFDFSEGIDPAVSGLLDSRSGRRYQAVPVRVDADGAIVVAMTDPSNVLAVDDLRMLLGREVRPALAAPDQIAQRLGVETRVDELVADLGDEVTIEESIDLGDPTRDASSAPIVRLVNQLIARGVDEGASDIHFEAEAEELRVRFRIDGVLKDVMSVPRSSAPGVASRIKVMADLDIAERRLPQDGRVGVKIAGRSLDLRVACVPSVHGENVVLRILDRGGNVLELASLGFTPDTLQRYERCWKRPYGAVLVTGPTGAGKSTTLYGTLQLLNTRDRKLMSVEDPVEHRLPGVTQVQVNLKAGLGFARVLRSFLRCDPDVMMVGEIRDRETAQIAIESALTGHMVLATLHTNDASSALTRLTEMGVEPFLSASSVVGVLAQRLVRKLCTSCREEFRVPHDQLMELAGLDALPRGLPDPAPLYRAKGCRRCFDTGYRGRVGVYECLVMSEDIQRLTAERASSEDIRRVARQEGMRTLIEDGLLKALRGETTLEELARTVA